MSLLKENSNLLVTGGCGFMGSAFIRYLISGDGGFSGQIVNLDLLTYAANPQSLRSIENSRRYHFYEGDIREKALLEHIFHHHEIDAIVHFAAETHVDRSIDDPALFLDTNVRGTFTLLEMVKQYPHLHFHHISTDEVYGSLGDSGLFYEYSPFRPNSPYAASKASADHLVRSYAQTYKLSTTSSFSCNNFGPFQYPEKLIPLSLTRALEKRPIPVYGSGKNIRSWIFVEEHAKAIWKILREGRKNQGYNIGGVEKNNLELLNFLLSILAEETGKRLEEYSSLLTHVQDRAGHDFRYALSSQKLLDETSFLPSLSLEDGLRKTVRHFLKQRDQKMVFSSMKRK